MSKRIYTVNNKADGSRRLVMAMNPAQALRHVAHAQYEVKSTTAVEVAELMGSGAKVEAAGEPEQEELTLA